MLEWPTADIRTTRVSGSHDSRGLRLAHCLERSRSPLRLPANRILDRRKTFDLLHGPAATKHRFDTARRHGGGT